ncbi:spore germination protein [Anaerobacillus alkalidiazotrophicus]|uniref:Spore germination protein n=1 Tax=Anaerobacillus alkalidiazotrophicus TaxID=472963 RepID=A0A1S2MCG3_9BACI|nr:spore germination protein [Anaerobacillus alkalidiazotrophicus]OIJ21517.1 spore germination protein [Anaerobacillus alkalidiazotrophicus]
MTKKRIKKSFYQQSTPLNDYKQEAACSNDTPIHFTGDLTFDLGQIQQGIGHNSDVNFREFHLGGTGIRSVIIFVDGLADKELIDKHIMSSLMNNISAKYDAMQPIENNSILTDYITNHVLSISQVEKVSTFKEVQIEVLKGSTALLINGSTEAIKLGTAKEKARSIEEPISEPLVRGPRVGFTEILSDNTALLRSNSKNEDLSVEKFTVGKRTNKELIIAYYQDIADPELVEEVKKRIKKIDIDDVLESGYVEQLIEDNYLSPFPQVQNTERPDRVNGALLEGRVAILLEGTPFALIVPVTFTMLLQSPEDYYERWLPSTLIRLLRFGAAFISITGPALYISFVSFHPGMIPTALAISIINNREGVPFPALIEALIMEISIEILREAGLRLPKPIGPAIGIVGGLIIGEAAVEAGIISSIFVIVVAITAISSFAIPQYSAGISLRFLRFSAMFFAAVFGLYGLILFFLFLFSHLVKLKSFGVHYLSPIAPYQPKDWKDLLVRAPLFMMKNRPKILSPKNSTRKG